MRYPPVYTAAVTSGQGLGGAMPSVIQLVMLLVSESSPSVSDSDASRFSNAGTVIYFLISAGLAGLGLVATLGLVHWEKCTKVQTSDTDEDVTLLQDSASSLISHGSASALLQEPEEIPDSTLQQVTRWKILELIHYDIVSIGLIFFVTLSLFPSITGAVASRSSPSNDLFSQRLFVTLHFLVFNLADWFGKSLPGFTKVGRDWSGRTLLGVSMARFLFVPLLLLCNVTLQNGVTHEPLPRLGETLHFSFF
jgi:equilibrative nucleoside transporter 1/2/3